MDESYGYSRRSEAASMLDDSVPGSPIAGSRMGFGGMPKVPSLVFDIELEDAAGRKGSSEDDQPGVRELRRWLLPSDSVEFKLRNDVELALEQHKACESTLDSNQWLASRLSRLGYKVHIRTALGGGDGFECLRNLRHVFLSVVMPHVRAGPSQKYVVDLSFKEQFSIAKPTQRYGQLLDCLPEVYVAPEASVAPLVNFLCQEIACAFRSNGAVLPPWRHASSMLSKWLPRKSLDESVASDAPTGSSQQQQHRAAASTAADRGCEPGTGAVNSAAITAPIAAALAGSGRRSLEGVQGYPGAHPVQRHWVMPLPPGMAHQQQIMQQINDHAPAAQQPQAQPVQPQQQAAAQQQPLVQSQFPFLHTRTAVKPIVCEPMKVVVGGNFISVGNA
mmetsp:Transcript_27473/g.69875  ORF Transcript_27473/g.69875 Transcript_27473/m.69875 type:complete len:390 (-) Transcript_27473:630-1799(-)|eukprot:CAMPEP_0202868868 /NCGR_PEP_ID=MMETSP1391-20130828/11262_1 /ASSEMBLY_ACC=CAM_ASM_000867 /TAXON_ID=1034604 /ORGANISM="Chlamydomonas leiostraca, Strain SAG 11-49" /LENGTH=389 /DNA_ID=CAMNT_0049549085 /DNA_START=119 /DNA_END=1288 /DNA_ORIENTATION=-